MHYSPRIVVYMPTYNADLERLHDLLAALSPISRSIVVFDDGSTPPLALTSDVTLERTNQNAGKGAGIKRALFRSGLRKEVDGVLFCDSDGQHRAADILRIYALATAAPDRVFLGVRDFSRGVPLRNRFGNTVIRALFRRFFCTDLRDTQTGLRYIPRALFGVLSQLPSTRFDYEMRQLCTLARNRIPIEQVPIETVYFHGNPSKFRAVRDSFRVVRALVGEWLSPGR